MCTRRLAFRFVRTAAASLLMTAAACAQQPAPAEGPGEHGTPPQPTGARSRSERDLMRQLMSLPPEERRARLRAFLVERQERARKANEALDRAIKTLDDGAPMDDLSKLIPPEAREMRGGGWSSNPFGPSMDGAAPPTAGEPGAPTTMSPDQLGPVSMPGMSGPGPGSGRGGTGVGAGRPEDGPPKPFEGPITDEDRAVVNEFIASAAPHLTEMFKQFEQKTERAEAKLRETLGRIRWLIDLRKVDRSAYDLRLEDIRHGREAFDAARELAKFDRAGADKAPSESRSAIVERMRTALSEQYRVRGELTSRDLARMESDLDKRKAELDKRAETRDATIARTMEKLTERAAEFQKRRERGGDERRRRSPENAPQAERAPAPQP